MPRRHVALRKTFSLLIAVLSLAAAEPAAAGWGADRAQTSAGTVEALRVAGANGDRIALGWSRRLSGEHRVELRLGRARSGLSSAPLLLDRSPGSAEAPLSTMLAGGAFAVAWRRSQAGNQRIKRRTVDRDGRLGPMISATTTGEPAYEPEWVPGATPALAWSRRTRADALELAQTGPRGVRLPSSPRSEPGLASGPAGISTVSWVADGRVLVADRLPSGGGFGAPLSLAVGEVNRTEVLRLPGGTTLVFWRQDSDLLVASRPAGGSFGGPRRVLESTTDAAQLALTGTGEVLVVAPIGDSSPVGELRLARLRPDGSALGSPRSLGRGRRAVLAADGTGSAFVAWMSEDAGRAVFARRIAAGGIVGQARALAPRSDSTSSPQLAATREGGAVVAWIAGGAAHVRTYRP